MPTSARTGFFPHLRQGTQALPYKNLVGRHPCVPPTTALLVICHCETSAHAGCGNPHPPSPKAPLPKGPWHGEAVTEGFHAGTFLQPSVGADDPVAVPKIFALPYGERLKF